MEKSDILDIVSGRVDDLFFELLKDEKVGVIILISSLRRDVRIVSMDSKEDIIMGLKGLTYDLERL